MTIDKSKLIELLVDKTGLEEKKVEEQLSLLILRVQQAAAQGKDFQIQGFGTFSIKDDALHFEPSKGLETEINHKYAGMKPIELIGAFKDMPPADDEVTKTEEPETDSGQKRSIEDILGIGKSPAKPEEPEDPTESAPVSQQGEQKEETEASSFVFDEESVADVDDPFDFDEDESIFGPADEPEESEEDEKDPIGTVLVICVVLLTIGVAGWSVYELDLLSFSGNNTSSAVRQAQVESPIQTTSEQEEEPVEETGRSSVQETQEDLNEPEPEGQGTESIPEGNSENENNIPGNTSVYGLMGSVNPDGNNGYTIVVHSLRDQGIAQRQQNELTSSGYRVMLTKAIVNGLTYWRVSLGQFETLPDAQDAVSSLPESYQNSNFIKRIQ